jgi:3-oxoacyl-[acyl-carrier-protein] synthase III
VRVPDTYITGLGVYIPERITIDQAVEKGLYPAARAGEHGPKAVPVAGEMIAPEMAVRAARQAISQSGVRPDDIDLLLYANSWYQGPEGWLPCSYVQHHLTSGNLLALELRQGSNGIFAGLQVAANYLHAESSRRHTVLVAADNFGTPLIDRWSSGPFVLGDAASAMVLSKEPGFARLLSVSAKTVVAAEEIGRGGLPLFPPSVTLGQQVSLAARVPGDSGERGLATVSSVDQQISDGVKEVFGAALSEAGVGMDDIADAVIANNAYGGIQQRHLDGLGLEIARSSREFGRSVGHCGASDQLLSLHHMITGGELHPGDHIAMFGMGPGVILACAIFEITDNALSH